MATSMRQTSTTLTKCSLSLCVSVSKGRKVCVCLGPPSLAHAHPTTRTPPLLAPHSPADGQRAKSVKFAPRPAPPTEKSNVRLAFGACGGARCEVGRLGLACLGCVGPGW